MVIMRLRSIMLMMVKLAVVWLGLMPATVTVASVESEFLSTGEDLIVTMAETYRGLSFYSDVTTSRLSVVSATGEIIENENQYQFVFDGQKGALIDNYLGQMFLISDWESVTNWFKHPARYSVGAFEMDRDWRDQFFSIGGMMN